MRRSILVCLSSLPLSVAAAAATIGFAAFPAAASVCATGAGRERVRDAAMDYQRISFTESGIRRADPRYAWTNLWGEITLYHGASIISADPALFQLIRYPRTYSIGLTSLGQYLLFIGANHSDGRITEIRLAAAPGLVGAPPDGPGVLEPRPGAGPGIAGYRFQMAERINGWRDTYLGLWRRTGPTGARTLLVLFSRHPDSPGGYATRIVARSDLAFSVISPAGTLHGGIWEFTLFTEAECPGTVDMLTYHWTLSIPPIGRPPAP